MSFPAKKETRINKFLDKRRHHLQKPSYYQSTGENVYEYYCDNSKELLPTDESRFIESDPEIDNSRYGKRLKLIKKYIGEYVDNSNNDVDVYIDPKTYRYRTDTLFRQLMDSCKYQDMCDDLGELLITKDMREAFYEFCYDNTHKDMRPYIS